MKKVLVPLADGFEEIEAVTIIDTLRRANVEVVTAFLKDKMVQGAHQICLEAQKNLNELKAEKFDAIILPGGMPGASNLLESQVLEGILKEHYASGKIIAAICAAPWILAHIGLLQGKKAVCYPGFEDTLKAGGALITKDNLVVDDTIITSRGPGTALAFALEIVTQLGFSQKTLELKKEMLF